MSARKGKRVVSKKAPKVKAIETVGRPPDDPLQSFFMKKLRDGKLQMINAQSVAEKASDKIRDLYPELIAKRKLKNDDDDYSQEKFGIVRDWFKKKMDPEHFSHLLNGFVEAVNKFEYRQILSLQDFPEYLFMDELDLTYVLHQIFRSQIPQLKTKTEFSNFELLFFALVSFALRDMISFKTLEVLQKLHDQILHNMEGLKEKIHSHYEKTQIAKAKQLKSQEEMGIEDVQEVEDFLGDNPISAGLMKGEINLSLKDIQKEQEEDSSKNQKTKKIQKAQKKTRGRPKSRDLEKEMRKSVDPKDLQQIIQKLITYISWSYSYIYPEEMKKKKELGLV